MDAKVSKILKTDYHRNGICGNGFTVSLFEPTEEYTNRKGQIEPSDMAQHEGPFLAIQFSDGTENVSMYTAIIALDDLFHWSQMPQEEYDALPSYRQNLNAWRGDQFAAEIETMVEKVLDKRWKRND